MKTIKILIGIVIAVICITSCTAYTCPTYSEVNDSCNENLFV